MTVGSLDAGHDGVMVRYEHIGPITRDAAEAAFARDDPHGVVRALIGLARRSKWLLW